MARVSVSVEVSKQSHALAQSLADIVQVVRAALADGWQPGLDIPVIITQVIGKLGAGLQGLETLKDDYTAENAAATSLALLLPIMGVVDDIVKELGKEGK